MLKIAKNSVSFFYSVVLLYIGYPRKARPDKFAPGTECQQHIQFQFQ